MYINIIYTLTDFAPYYTKKGNWTLIGFQIYNSIAIADKLKEYERGANKAALKEVEKYSHSVKSYVYTFLTIDLINQNGDERAIANLMIAVDEGRKERTRMH